MTQEQIRAHFEQVKKVFGPEKHKAIPMFDNIVNYPLPPMIQLNKLSRAVEMEPDPQKQQAWIQEFVNLRDSIKPLAQIQEPIQLWPEDVLPTLTEYTDNSEFKYNHDPDFRPYMYALTVAPGVAPKGAVVVIPGGDHGECTMTEGYQVCLDFNALGYQCFLLQNRVNHNPWNEKESGVDTARAIRYIRAHAKEYGIAENHVAVAGFSNGGLTGENCIRYFSGKQSVADHFHGYIPDALDDYYGAPDAYLCIYGPRFKGAPFDYTDVVYPPTFFAVGREDFAMENLNALYPDLIAHGVHAEVHTFAATPHGMAGISLIDGEVKYPNFQLWVPLADAFMQDVYNEDKGN